MRLWWTCREDFSQTNEQFIIVSVYPTFFLENHTGQLKWSFVNLAELFLLKLHKSFETLTFFEVFLTKLLQCTPKMHFWHFYNTNEGFLPKVGAFSFKVGKNWFLISFFQNKIFFVNVFLWTWRIKFCQPCWHFFAQIPRKMIFWILLQKIVQNVQFEGSFDCFAKSFRSLSKNDSFDVRKIFEFITFISKFWYSQNVFLDTWDAVLTNLPINYCWKKE